MNPTEELVDLLDLERLDGDLFRGKQPESARARVYGGQVAAQALMAGIRTVPAEFAVHSLHSYFLLGGDYSVPIVYDVERIRDGRSFLTRRVVARQHGRPIYYQTLNFQLPEEGYEHQDAMPEVGAPETGFDLVDVMRKGGNDEADALGKEWGALDVRWLGNTRFGLEPDDGHVSQARMWIRLREGLPDDPAIHVAAFTYASDVSLLGSTLSVARREPVEDADGLARPHAVVPPALPRRRLVALRPVVAVGAGRPRPGVRPDLHRRRHARGHRRAGGPDPAARAGSEGPGVKE